MKRAALALLLSSIASAGVAGPPAPAPEALDGKPDEGLSAVKLAKMTQNLVANLISVPIQWNMVFGANWSIRFQCQFLFSEMTARTGSNAGQ